jgi:DNA-binding transcriptional regulator GbsR (MarR family)
MTDEPKPLSPLAERFILHWGEMGTRWGINRTVAQIHALLYLSAEPMHAEAIAAVLSVARSNVSNSLRELQGWGLIRVAHVLGDRRDHFESLKDVWQMFQIVVDERKRREVDPTLAMLRESVGASRDGGYEAERLQEMLGFFESMSGAYDELRRVSPSGLKRLMRARATIRRFFRGEEK